MWSICSLQSGFIACATVGIFAFCSCVYRRLDCFSFAGFGISSKLWDYPFRTLIRKNKKTRSSWSRILLRIPSTVWILSLFRQSSAIAWCVLEWSVPLGTSWTSYFVSSSTSYRQYRDVGDQPRNFVLLYVDCDVAPQLCMAWKSAHFIDPCILAIHVLVEVSSIWFILSTWRIRRQLLLFIERVDSRLGLGKHFCSFVFLAGVG